MSVIRPRIGTSAGAGASGGGGTTVSTTDYYVDSAGSDSNPGTVGSPFLTIQKAVDSVPKTIRNKVTINVGAGSFAAAVFTGFTVSPSINYGSDYSWLHLKGTMSNVSPQSTGSSSGTLTSYTASSNATFATAADTTNNMTVNEYAGCYLQAVTGTGSTGTVAFPALWLIESNTSTVFTIQSASGSAMAAGTTYQVVKPGTFINSGTTPSVSTGNPAQSGMPSAGGSFGLAFVQNLGMGYAVSNIEFTQSASMLRGIVFQESKLRVFDCRFIAASGSSPTSITYGSTTHMKSTVLCYGVYANLTGSTNGTFYQDSQQGGGPGACGLTMTSCTIKGGVTGVFIAGSANGPLINNCKFDTQTGISLSLFGCGMAQIVNSRITGSTTGVSAVESSISGLGATTFALNAFDISNCTTAIIMTGAFIGCFLTAVSGTTNTTAINITRGAKCCVSANTTLTGTTEVSIDGVGTTLAAMRALVPPVYPAAPTTLGTAFYQ